MKSRFFALASAALVAAAVAAPAAHAATSVVISQVAFRGPRGGNDEVIEIRNISGAAVDIGGWELWGSNSNTPPRRARARPSRPGRTLPAGKTFVFANSAGTLRRQPATSRYSTGHRRHRRRRRSATAARPATIIDAVGSHSGAAAYREGAGLPFPARPAPRRVHPQERRHAGHRRQRRRLHRPAALDARRSAAPTARRPSPPGPCDPATDGTTPITKIQTLGANAACNGTTVTVRGIVTGIDDLYGSNFDEHLQGRLGHLGPGRRRATRQATTSSALFVAGIAAPGDPRRRTSARTSRSPAASRRSSASSQIVPDGVGSTSNPDAPQVDARPACATTNSQQQPAPGPGRCSTETAAEAQDAITRPYYRSLQGMRVQLPGRHRDRRRHDQVPRRVRRAGHRARAPVPQEQPGGDRHAVVGRARRARHLARRRRRQPGRPAHDVVQRRRRSTSTSSTSSTTSSAR